MNDEVGRQDWPPPKRVHEVNPEVQIQAMEDEQIIVSAAYFTAYHSLVGNGKILTNQDIVTELKKYDNYDDTRLLNLIAANGQRIDRLVQQVFDATIVP